MNFEIGQKVEVMVERVLPFGVFARLRDGILGHIPQRKLNLDSDDASTRGLQLGDVLTAMVIKSEKTESHLELRRRATVGNPGMTFAGQFSIGDVVRRAMQTVQPSDIYIRVAAGVRGSISWQEMASWVVTRPEGLFRVGDDVEVIILGLDPHNQRLSFSIRSRMMQCIQAREMYRAGPDEPIEAQPDCMEYLQQVFVNIMQSAFQQVSVKSHKYNWNGPRVLKVSSSLTAARDKVLLRFTDTGPGIPWRVWETIFGPDSSTLDGSGLGLYIERSLLKPTGGTMCVEESLILQGTTLLVELSILKLKGGIAP